MKIVNKRVYTDKAYIELLEKRINKALKEIDGYIRLCAPADLNYLSDILRGKE